VFAPEGRTQTEGSERESICQFRKELFERYTEPMEASVSTSVADQPVGPLPWQLELRRLSIQLAGSDDRKLTIDELQRETRELSLNLADRKFHP